MDAYYRLELNGQLPVHRFGPGEYFGNGCEQHFAGQLVEEGDTVPVPKLLGCGDFAFGKRKEEAPEARQDPRLVSGLDLDERNCGKRLSNLAAIVDVDGGGEGNGIKAGWLDNDAGRSQLLQ